MKNGRSLFMSIYANKYGDLKIDDMEEIAKLL